MPRRTLNLIVYLYHGLSCFRVRFVCVCLNGGPIRPPFRLRVLFNSIQFISTSTLLSPCVCGPAVPVRPFFACGVLALADCTQQALTKLKILPNTMASEPRTDGLGDTTC